MDNSSNPLDLPLPPDRIARIRAFARDLAYGALHKLWPSSLRLFHGEEGWVFAGQEGDNHLQDLLLKKWGAEQPGFDMLQTFGYATLTADSPRVAYAELQLKAFELLERPVAPPSVFISYGRRQSSALALLVEARLAAVGARAFLDRSIDPGEVWHAQLQAMVRGSTYFVSLIGPGTLNSPHVREEISWATQANVLSVAIWHSGFTFRREDITDCPDWLADFVTSRHAIRVQEESAEGYHDAVEKLINRLGYTR